MAINKINFVDVFFFLALLFIGGDLLSVDLFGFTFRLVNLFILTGFLLLILKNDLDHYLPKKFFISSLMLLVAMFFSLPFSYDKQRTIAYIFWFIFYIFIMAPFFYNFASRNSPIRVLKFWFLTYRIQVLFLACEFIYSISSGEFARPHLWFYEPSYAAIYFSLYFGANIFLRLNSNIRLSLDLYLSIFALLILASTTAIFGLVVGGVIAIFLSKNKIKYLSFFAFFSFLFFLAIQFLFAKSEYFNLTFGFFGNSEGIADIFSKFMFRSGTRIIRLLWGWDAFLNHPFTGVGFGADQTYTKIESIPEIAEPFITPQDSAWGNPFVNPFIEALGTMGFFGFVCLLYSFSLLIFLYRKSIHTPHAESRYVLATIIGVIVLVCTLQMEGTFLRYYLWSSYMIAWGMLNRIQTTK